MKYTFNNFTTTILIPSILFLTSHASTANELLFKESQGWKMGTSRIDIGKNSIPGTGCELQFNQGKLTVSSSNPDYQVDSSLEIKTLIHQKFQSATTSRSSYIQADHLTTTCPNGAFMTSQTRLEFDLKTRFVFISRDYECPEIGKLPQYRESIQCHWQQ